jgi:hypothetical protein
MSVRFRAITPTRRCRRQNRPRHAFGPVVTADLLSESAPPPKGRYVGAGSDGAGACDVPPRHLEVKRIAGAVTFYSAQSVARQQQAKSWELRAAMSLARLWRDQGGGRICQRVGRLIYASRHGRGHPTPPRSRRDGLQSTKGLTRSRSWHARSRR